MTPGPDDDISAWQQRLDEGRAAIVALELDGAARVLGALVEETRRFQGTAAERARMLASESLAECLFQQGQAALAIAPMEEALALARTQGDVEGVSACLLNLHEIHRYLGNREAGADQALRLAEHLEARGRLDEAQHWRRQASRVRAGEPLNRVVVVLDGQRHELDALPPIGSARVEFVFERSRPTLRRATMLASRAERLAERGQYREALATFGEAADADPYAPQPRYLEGLTLLHLGRYNEAALAYQAVDQLAPGWYECRADLWLAHRLAERRFPKEAFFLLSSLEDTSLSPERRLQLAERGLGSYPDLAPLHLFRGRSLEALGRRDEARAAFRRGLDATAEPDLRTRLLLRLAMATEPVAERRALLGEARDLGGNLVAAAMAVVALRAAGGAT